MNLREVYLKHGRLVVFIRLDSAQIWGVSYCFDSHLTLALKKLWPAPVFLRLWLEQDFDLNET